MSLPPGAGQPKRGPVNASQDMSSLDSIPNIDFSGIHEQAYQAAQEAKKVPQNGYVETALMAITALKMLKESGIKIKETDEKTADNSAKYLIAMALGKAEAGYSYDPDVNRFLDTYNAAVDAALGYNPRRG